MGQAVGHIATKVRAYAERLVVFERKREIIFSSMQFVRKLMHIITKPHKTNPPPFSPYSALGNSSQKT